MKTPFPETSALPEGPLTFADYFKLNADVEDILAGFGYGFRVENCDLPHKELDADRLVQVRRQIERVFPHVSLSNEVARREFLIAPVLMEAADQVDAKIRVEFPLEIDDQLKGTIDYFIRAKHNVLVVEAKNGDLKRGFTQLAIELLALDRWAGASTETRLRGAVSMGDVWKFGFLDRAEKVVIEDFNTYSVPKDLEEVLRILAALLSD